MSFEDELGAPVDLQSGASPQAAPEEHSEETPKYLGKFSKDTVAKFIKFCFIGGSGVVVNTLVMILLHKLNGGPENGGDEIFNIPLTDFWVRYRNLVFLASFLVANLWNYLLNRRYTFKDTYRGMLSGYGYFLAVGTLGAVIGLVLQVVLTHHSSPLFLPDPWFTAEGTWRSRELWAQLIAVLISTPINFVATKLFALPERKTKSKGVSSVESENGTNE
jgi:putative flippase GtrA